VAKQTRHLTPEEQDEYRLTTMIKKDRKKALAVADGIRDRIEEMERDLDRQYADNFVGVLNLTRADLVNMYGSVWMSKSQYQGLDGSSRFVISRTTVAPKSTQSEPEDPVAGTIVLTKPMITWLQVTYGTAGSSSLDSMEQEAPDNLNEGIKDEDLKIKEIGEPHEVREGRHGLCRC
jgi:hypothetical protein